MVYDWFNRGTAPQNPEEPQPEQAPQAPVAEEKPAAAAPAVGAVDQDALDWARQAYARLKAQQDADKEAAAPPLPAPAPPLTTFCHSAWRRRMTAGASSIKVPKVP